MLVQLVDSNKTPAVKEFFIPLGDQPRVPRLAKSATSPATNMTICDTDGIIHCTCFPWPWGACSLQLV